MNHTRIAISLIVMVVAAITVGVAQTPTNVLTLPEGVDLPTELPRVESIAPPIDGTQPAGHPRIPGNLAPLRRADPLAQRKIREALEGRRLGGSSGNVMLDDILNIIQTEGSILDGSVLDPDQDDVPQSSDESARALAAERLLRASRTLEQLGDDHARASLVKQMRSEAARLLTE